MFREQVAMHYRAKGYRVEESVKVRGGAGTVFACDLVVQGPLGNLVVDFSEDGDGLEMGGLRRKAKELGATPVLAAPRFPPALRPLALRVGVVLLDEDSLREEPAVEPPAPAPEPHPWPRRVEAAPAGAPAAWPGQRRPEEGAWEARDVDEVVSELATPATASGDRMADRAIDPVAVSLWRRPPGPVRGVRAARERFAWLRPSTAEPATPEPTAPAGGDGTPEPTRGVGRSPPGGPPSAGHAQAPSVHDAVPGAPPASGAAPDVAPGTTDAAPDTAPRGLSQEIPPTQPGPGRADATSTPHRPARPQADEQRLGGRRPRARRAEALLSRTQAAQAAVAGIVSGLVVLGGLAWLLF